MLSYDTLEWDINMYGKEVKVVFHVENVLDPMKDQEEEGPNKSTWSMSLEEDPNVMWSIYKKVDPSKKEAITKFIGPWEAANEARRQFQLSIVDYRNAIK